MSPPGDMGEPDKRMATMLKTDHVCKMMTIFETLYKDVAQRETCLQIQAGSRQ